MFAEKRAVTQATTFVGRVQAKDRVEVKARVTGYLEEILFKEGDVVAAGAPLYRIESGPFEAAVRQAEGEVLRAQGQLTNAMLQRQRSDELVKTGAQSVAVRDERVAAEQTAQGNLASAQAALQNARINLGYTQIMSPIAGRIGRSAVTKGNVVGPESGTLTTIVSVDPMYVLFPVSQREFLELQKEGQQTHTAANAAGLLVRLRFSDGSLYSEPGRINFVDVTVNQATDTVLVRATVPNPKGVLVDGQLLQAAVEQEKPVERILVPQAALIADQEGVYVFIVEDGKAAVRRVKVGGDSGPNAVIADGLKGGEQVVVEGLGSLRAGAPVQASPVASMTGG
ncbi:efflux RND transporter periplasmic adaptor subunit [Enhydrobacter sp.]|uniref:efflux RND transporter periplasmic adaptor subunit n=1 Tax=Enhydrobacter sp. TaxID=1894999 RepID=UPI00262F9FDC|nr:efflux RND transporter periplasmic adaptor subunit [Enhydrobacter sp.]